MQLTISMKVKYHHEILDYQYWLVPNFKNLQLLVLASVTPIIKVYISILISYFNFKISGLT